MTDELIRIGTGRDASDVSFSTFFGTATLRRLSPLVAFANEGETLAEPRTSTSGIVMQDVTMDPDADSMSGPLSG